MKFTWQTVIFLIVFTLTIGVGIFLKISQNRFGDGLVVIAGRTLQVEVAKTDAARERGLSGHAPLTSNQGMLFIFPTSSRYVFWMKDMLFPIDIIWIQDGKVADLSVNVPISIPGEELPRFRPIVSVDTVLEVQAGFAQAAGLKVGDPVELHIDR